MFFPIYRFPTEDSFLKNVKVWNLPKLRKPS